MAHEQTKTEDRHEVAVKPSKEVTISFGPVQIQTAEDAAFAFLREEISEDQLREACGKFGTLPGTLLYSRNPNERVDASYKRKLPEDLYEPIKDPDVSLEDKLKAVEEKQKARDEASKESEDKTKDVQPVKIVQA